MFRRGRQAFLPDDPDDSSSLRQWAFEVGDRSSSLRSYRGFRWFCRRTLLPYLNVKSENVEVLEHSGPMVLAPVHRSHLDTVIVASLCERRLRALGKESLFTTPGLGWVCAALGAIPVRRGSADREALKAAKALLDRGEAMFVFPEGSRFTSDDRAERNRVQELFDGAAWLAARTGAVVIPIGISGTAEALASGSKRIRRSQVGVSVAAPMQPPAGVDGGKASRQDLADFTMQLRENLQRAQDRAVALVMDTTS